MAALAVLLVRVSGEGMAIRQNEITEIFALPRLAALPGAPPILVGAFHLSGVPVLVLRLAALLGLRGAPEGDPFYHHLLLLPERPQRPRLALLVDRATAILAAEPVALPPGESFNDCIEGNIRLDGTLLPLVSAERLLSQHEAARLAAFMARAAERAAAFSPVVAA